MKTMMLLSVLGLLIGMNSQAASGAYCDDLGRLDQRPQLDPFQLKNFYIDGEKADLLIVSKDRKKLYLVKNDIVLKSYDVALGGAPMGHKQFEGDQKTPEGVYTIDSKNPDSNYHKALHISYPNKADSAFAKSKGRSAGGDIMVHGLPNDSTKRQLVSAVHPFFNWTNGCIAVTDQEIDEIYTLVNRGTKIEICKWNPPPTPQPPQDGGTGSGTTISIPGN